MANVKVFVNKHTDKQRGQKQYAPYLPMRGNKKIIKQDCQSKVAHFLTQIHGTCNVYAFKHQNKGK